MIKWNNFIQNDNQENLAGMKIDSAFRKLSKNTICFHIWKIEEDRLETIPKAQFGTFYDDCTYIIYAACNIGEHVTQDTITRATKSTSSLQRFIHFWLGEKTTPPKSGNVAFKVMELDNYFDNVTIQYRETQGNESTRFLSYFKKGVTVLSSALIDVGQEWRLFQITGRQWPICTEKETISWEHFNSDYIMVLKTPARLFVWLGRSSSALEKRNALSITERMSEIYNVSEITVVDDGYEQSMSKLDKEEWNFYLPLKDRFVTQTAAIEKPTVVQLKLYKCGYNAGKYRVEELKTTDPEQSDLNDSESAFIIDASLLGVWIWVGKLTGRQEKMEAMRNARGFVKKKKYSYSTPVIRVIEGHEPAEFTRLFPTWKNCNNSANNISKMLGKLESLVLLQRPKMAAETQLIDDGTGEKHLFRITNGQQEQNDFICFSTDCYILHYIITFSDGNHIHNGQTKCSNVIYFWAGKDVSPEVRSECETFSENYFENLPKNSIMIKISEGFETPHFLQIFGGKFIVFKGQNASVNKSPQIPFKFVLKVFGDSTFNSKAIQSEPLTITTSKDCYVIKSSDVWVWCGQCSTGDAREGAKKIGALMGEYTLVMETKEPDEFWDNVSGMFFPAHLNGFHENGNSYPEIDAPSTPAAGLYLCYLEHSSIETKEIMVFNQSDLAPEEIYLLDVGNIIFIWIGELSSLEGTRSAWLMAKQFLNSYPIQRNENCAIALVRQGYEPNIFTGFFENWDEKYLNNHLSYEKIRKKLEKNPTSNVLPVSKHEAEFDKHTKYPLSILQQEADLLPSGINITKKEIHLTHDDFFEIFRMNFCEFENLPSWKKQELKKRHKLF